MIALFGLILVSYVAACDLSNNDPVLNADCNYAGTCVSTQIGFNTFRRSCKCCAPEELDSNNECGESWVCDPNNSGWGCVEFSGETCDEYNQFYYVNMGARLVQIDESVPADLTCSTDPYMRATYGQYLTPSAYFEEQLQVALESRGWSGTVTQQPLCDSCSVEYPCTLYIAEGVIADVGIGTLFQIDFNSYYNSNCSTVDWIEETYDIPDCEANYDYGQTAFRDWEVVTGDLDSGDISLMNAINDVLQSEPNVANSFTGLGWTNIEMIGLHVALVSETHNYVVTIPTRIPTEYPTERPTELPTEFPTLYPTEHPTDDPTTRPTGIPTTRPTGIPTNSPTNSPTGIPTQTPTKECADYTNNVDSLKFKGVGSNCRAGLNNTWPGGLSCASPYIVCLPQENTPAAFGGDAYASITHRYSVSECIQECANDMRCLGIEFVADSASPLGNCSLIDDIPVEITSMVSGFNYDHSMSYSNLDSSVTSGDAMCFEKDDACYTQFEAEDLDDVMLNCYCPNNRKGYYTKKVKRTVDNTRFCGNDNDVNLRVQKAQANRMFHLCENWCLFQTEDPEAESWYWDPWNTCWREQNDNSYCSRVIKNPDTIEMQFINHRRNQFC